jgi:hypothetical protein
MRRLCASSGGTGPTKKTLAPEELALTYSVIFCSNKNVIYISAPAEMKQNTIEMTHGRWLCLYSLYTAQFSWTLLLLKYIWNANLKRMFVGLHCRVRFASTFFAWIILRTVHLPLSLPITELKYIRWMVMLNIRKVESECASQVVKVQSTKYYSFLTNWSP